MAVKAAGAGWESGGAPRANRLFNRLAVRLAGTRWMPLYGVLEHRGRRSGNVYRTPVVARPTADGFVVPMPWGEGTDWYRNVRAAGGCTIRWKDREYVLEGPEVVDDPSAVEAAFNGFQRMMVKRLGIRQYLRLRHAGGPTHR